MFKEVFSLPLVCCLAAPAVSLAAETGAPAPSWNNPANPPSDPADYKRFFAAFGELPIEKQVAYVKFPLKHIVWEMGEDDPAETRVYNNPQQFLKDYKWILPSKKVIRENPPFKPEIKLINQHEAHVTVWFCHECDGSISFDFKHENGRWILVEVSENP